jgi:hypothetical protein
MADSIYINRVRIANPDVSSPQECPPPCPACGGLECFCRPHFFAGQLLTDEDLNLLDHYIVEKNKLHNRYLHGHGIVCGLDVSCDACGSQTVIVRPGYALSPCGDDIVVCKDTVVNICDLISQCCPSGTSDCDPFHNTPPTQPPQGMQDWVLAICYDEKPSRGMTALRAETPKSSCCSSCSCKETSSGCGCGCHSAKKCTGKDPMPPQYKKRLPQCEPTMTCESYKFVVYRYIDPTLQRVPDDGLKRNMAYIASRLPQPPADNATMLTWSRFGNDYRDAVFEIISREACFSEEDKRRIASMASPEMAAFGNDTAAYANAIKRYVGNVSVGLVSYIAPQICRTFKLHCPGPIERNCIPLARVKVSQPECRVVSICEVSVREYVLSALLERIYEPLRSTLTRLLDWICCDHLRRLTPEALGANFAGRISSLSSSDRLDALNALEGRGAKPLDARELLEGAFADRTRAIDAETLALAMLGARDEQGKLYVRPEEMADPTAFLFASQFLRPVLEAALPQSWSGLLGAASKPGALEPADVSVTAELRKLKKTVTALEKDLKTHKTTIDELRKRLDNH